MVSRLRLGFSFITRTDITTASNSTLQKPGALASHAKDKRVQGLGRALLDHCTRYLSQKSADAFFKAVCDVLEAHIEEIYFLQGRFTDSLAAYMSIRSRTIALNPFFEVIKSEYLSKSDWEYNALWRKLQQEVSRVCGLQNDLIGLVRDLEDGEQLNAVMVLMRGFSAINKHQLDHEALSRCVALVNAEHNRSAARSFEFTAQIHGAAEASDCSTIERFESVARHILMMCETHLRWCSSAKRYRLEVGVHGNPVTAHGQSDAASHPQPTATRTAEQGQARPIRSLTPASQQLVLQSDGIFHGLPTFPDAPSYRNLTALVTGATGLSGYHMVKALAASPQRWSKIYCLSSRPPPENFFADLGEGAQRVEHLAVNFLDNPSEFAKVLKEKVQHV